jgi:hypothetical protein
LCILFVNLTHLGKILVKLITGNIEHSGTNGRVFFWVGGCVIKFLQMNKERVERKEITAATALNCVKAIKLFSGMNDLSLNWRKISKAIPKGRRVGNDRIPTLVTVVTI